MRYYRKKNRKIIFGRMFLVCYWSETFKFLLLLLLLLLISFFKNWQPSGFPRVTHPRRCPGPCAPLPPARSARSIPEPPVLSGRARSVLHGGESEPGP